MIIKLNIHAVDTISHDTRSSVLRLLKCAHVTSCHRKGRNALLQRRDCQSLPACVTLSRDGHRVWELLGRWSSNFFRSHSRQLHALQSPDDSSSSIITCVQYSVVEIDHAATCGAIWDHKENVQNASELRTPPPPNMLMPGRQGR
jgi:hypothetical protein